MNGRYTGITDLELTPAGVNQVMATGTRLVGPGKLIDPASIAHVWVSPRKRARQTCQLIFNGVDDITDKLTLTNDIAEWDYGDYEGLVADEIRARRKEKGLDRERDWSVWRDGCEGGEYISPILSNILMEQSKIVLIPWQNL
ncbi:MAG: hypothetical protein Q9169_000112 [Polycauliona sp. 2 TL-2023]